MDIDVSQTASAAVPYLTALVAVYGKDTLDKVRDVVIDHTSDATVQLGRNLLERLLRREGSRVAIEEAVIDVAHGEAEGEASLRLQVRKALAHDAELAHEISTMLSRAQNGGILSAGDNAFNVGAQHNHGPGVFIGRDYRPTINGE